MYHIIEFIVERGFCAKHCAKIFERHPHIFLCDRIQKSYKEKTAQFFLRQWLILYEKMNHFCDFRPSAVGNPDVRNFSNSLEIFLSSYSVNGEIYRSVFSHSVPNDENPP